MRNHNKNVPRLEELDEVDADEFLNNRFTYAFVVRAIPEEINELRKAMKRQGMQEIFTRVSTHKLFITNDDPNGRDGGI